MKARASILLFLGVVVTLTTVLIPAAAFAQSEEQPSGAQALLAGGMLLVMGIIGLAAYAYFALALQAIANKTHTANAWWAWIPILQAILMLNIAKKPIWWIILFLIPLVGLVIGIIVWMGIAEARGKPSWWGIMLIVPVMNIVMPGYLAWSD